PSHPKRIGRVKVHATLSVSGGRLPTRSSAAVPTPEGAALDVGSRAGSPQIPLIAVDFQNVAQRKKFKVPRNVAGGSTNHPHAHFHVAVHSVQREIRGCYERVPSVRDKNFRMEFQMLVVGRKSPR